MAIELVQRQSDERDAGAYLVDEFPSLQVNINAGELPKPENNEVAYLKVPLNYL